MELVWYVIRIPAGTHLFGGGPDGAGIVAFGAPNTENKDVEMLEDWWGEG